VLVSNGAPAWYGEGGTEHTAEAYTWRRIATGGHGTAWRHGYGTAHLPLNVASSGPTVIDVLRDARHTDRNWITVDIDPADRHRIPPNRVRAADHRDQLVPADAAWVEAAVTATAVCDASYPALVPAAYTTSDRFEIPRFDRHTVEQMIADLDVVQATDVMPGEYPHLRFAGDVLLLIEARDTADATIYREVDRTHPDSDGRYAVGAYGWSWRRA
jgi:hypothetical protein